MKKLAQCFLTLAFLSFSQAQALEVKQVAGDYELQGVMEMAGGLHLDKNQSYQAGFSYGAADWMEEGAWKIEGNAVVLQKGKLKNPVPGLLSPFLSDGLRFQWETGKLTGSQGNQKIVFLNPNRTPSPATKTADSAGEGRMRVKGKVVRLDAESLVVQMQECIDFNTKLLSKSVLKTAKENLGKSIDVEIPYSAIRGGGSCP